MPPSLALYFRLSVYEVYSFRDVDVLKGPTSHLRALYE